MANKPLEAWNPAWDQEIEAARRTAAALGVDSLAIDAAPSARRPRRPPRSTRCSTASAYDKGAAVLNMLEGYLGPEVLRAG